MQTLTALSLSRSAAAIALAAIATIFALPASSDAASDSDRKVVEWTFDAEESSEEIESQLRALEAEVLAKYQWQVEWAESELEIIGKFFDGTVEFSEGHLRVRMEMGSTLYLFRGTIRDAFEKELEKYLHLI